MMKLPTKKARAKVLNDGIPNSFAKVHVGSASEANRHTASIGTSRAGKSFWMAYQMQQFLAEPAAAPEETKQ